MLIRDADPRLDAAACAAIYAPFVKETAVTFEESAPDGAAMAERILTVTRDYPWLVAEAGGEVAGYAYASRHRERAAYRWAVEVAVYVAAEHRRRGVGAELYGALFSLLAGQGLRIAIAGITLPNPASVALHEACGFERIGVYRHIGWKAGAWRDVGWWQRDLAPAGEVTPDPPRPPERLGGDRGDGGDRGPGRANVGS